MHSHWRGADLEKLKKNNDCELITANEKLYRKPKI